MIKQKSETLQILEFIKNFLSVPNEIRRLSDKSVVKRAILKRNFLILGLIIGLGVKAELLEETAVAIDKHFSK